MHHFFMEIILDRKRYSDATWPSGLFIWSEQQKRRSTTVTHKRSLWGESVVTLGFPYEGPNSTREDTASTWETGIQIWTTCLFLDTNIGSMIDVGVISTWFVTHDWKIEMLQ